MLRGRSPSNHPLPLLLPSPIADTPTHPSTPSGPPDRITSAALVYGLEHCVGHLWRSGVIVVCGSAIAVFLVWI